MLPIPAIFMMTSLLCLQDKPQASSTANLSNADELGGFEGVVRSSVTGEPVGRVLVIALPLVLNAAPPRPSSTMTNSEGKYVMKGLPPGNYKLAGERTGYVRTEYSTRSGYVLVGTPVQLEKGQTLKNLDIALVPQGVVTGRVQDGEGEPIPHAEVTLLRQMYLQGRRRLVATGQSVTNDLGEYRIAKIPPGKFYLSVAAKTVTARAGLSDKSAESAREDSYPLTWYPGTDEFGSANPVSVTAGATTPGLDFTLRAVPAFKLAGRVQGVNAQASGMVTLVAKDSMSIIGLERSTAHWRGPSGEFEIRGVRPGTYILMSDQAEAPDRRIAGRMQIEITIMTSKV